MTNKYLNKENSKIATIICYAKEKNKVYIIYYEDYKTHVKDINDFNNIYIKY